MIIDAHNHADWYGYNLTRTLANMDQNGIDRAWVLTWDCPASEFDPSYLKNVNVGAWENGPIQFERCLSYALARPDRFTLGYAPDPRRPDAIDRLKSAVALYGVKVCGEIKLRMTYDDPDALRLYRYCGEAGLPVTVHIDYEFPTGRDYPRPNYWYGGGIDALERALKKCPDTIFLGHAPGFWAHISGDDQFDRVPYPKGPVLPGGRVIELLNRCPNLYGDLSAGSGLNALTRDPAFGRAFVIEYQDRLLYARDYFDGAHRAWIDGQAFPQEVLNKIYCRNALRLIHEI